MANQLLRPKTQEELCNLMQDLHTTICAEMSAMAYATEEAPYAPDMIKLTTATLHLLYLVNQDNKKVPVLWSPAWIGCEDDRFYQVLNGLQLLANPISADPKILNGMDWTRVATMGLSETLVHLLADCDFEVYFKCVARLVGLLGFTPEGTSRVTYEVINLQSGKELCCTYTKRFH